jgi:hypothetical protein
MPPAAREPARRGTTRTDSEPVTESPPVVTDNTTEDTTESSAAPAGTGTGTGTRTGTGTGASLAGTAGHLALLPVTVAMAVVDDIASTARRPDALVYWGGLAAMATLGVLEWPVAAAVGVGVAVANGRRRARAGEPG